MKKKKGFTLIELLAVIVILALILVITVPKILDVVEKSRMEAFKSSAGLMGETAQINHNSNAILHSNGNPIEYIFKDGDYYGNSPELNFKGDKPDNGIIRVDANGRVSLALISKDKKYCATKEYNDKVKVKLEDGTCETSSGLKASVEEEIIDLAYISKDIFKKFTFPFGIRSISFKTSDQTPSSSQIGPIDISSGNDGLVHLYGIIDGPANRVDVVVVSSKKISTIDNSTENMFSNMSVLESVSFSNFDTSNVTTMEQMFYNSSNLSSIEYLNNFKTKKVTDFSQMFHGCHNLTSIDVSSFNTAKATTFRYMFGFCKEVETLNLLNFSTRNVTDFSGMFANCEKLKNLNVNNFNTTNATTMGSMFDDCKSLKTLDLSSFNTKKCEEFYNMFGNMIELETLNISNFDTTSAVSFQLMFYNCKKLKSLNLSHFVAPNLIYIDRMFYGCEQLSELNLSNITSESLVQVGNLFKDCTSLTTLDLSNFNSMQIDYSNSLNLGAPLFENTPSQMTIYVKNTAAQQFFDSQRTTADSNHNTTFIIK